MLENMLNRENQMGGLELLGMVPDEYTKLVFFDPQYRQILDKQKYGNEGARQSGRASLPAMSTETINEFLSEASRVLKPSGHLMLWIDKFILVEGVSSVLSIPEIMLPVDMITWDKGRIGMGYRTRRKSEYLVIFQKEPKRARDVWTVHNIPDVWKEEIPDVWEEKVLRGGHPHAKPLELQKSLITAVTEEGDVVVDPAAGGFSVMKVSLEARRNFLGTNLS